MKADGTSGGAGLQPCGCGHTQRFLRYALEKLSHVASLALLALLVSGCSAPAPDDSTYPERIMADRAEKDRAFSESSDSPIPLERRAALLPLSYFPPDLDYRVPAALRVADDPQVFEIPTSTGQIRSELRVGILEFTLKGQPLKLSAFVEVDAPTLDRLFVPFGDPTNGTESYQAGRYLELDLTATGNYDVDFNRAFHPYCYYDERYDCPFPPPENRLPIEIRAGERLPADGATETSG